MPVTFKARMIPCPWRGIGLINNVDCLRFTTGTITIFSSKSKEKLHWFSKAAITRFHKLGGLKSQHRKLEFWKREIEIKVASRAMLPLKILEQQCSRPFSQLLVSLAILSIPWLADGSFHSSPHHHMIFPVCLCVFSLFIRTPVI